MSYCFIQVWLLRNAAEIAPQIEPRGTHDACFVPRSAHVTGDIRCHEIAWAGDELWLVNTRFSSRVRWASHTELEFERVTLPTDLQRRVFELLGLHLTS